MATGLQVVRFGDWAKAQNILKVGMAETRRAMGAAWKREGQFLRKQLVEGIRNQAPGGKEFRPLAATTIAIRRFLGFRGTKALVWHADLLRSINVTSEGRVGAKGYEVFVGVHRDALDRHGRPVIRIMELNENGGPPTVIKVTPKMRRFLHAAFGKQRALRRLGPPHPTTGIIVLQIPPRPVFGPVWAYWGPSSPARVMATARLELRGTFLPW